MPGCGRCGVTNAKDYGKDYRKEEELRARNSNEARGLLAVESGQAAHRYQPPTSTKGIDDEIYQNESHEESGEA
jgi:hypothetical protein